MMMSKQEFGGEGLGGKLHEEKALFSVQSVVLVCLIHIVYMY